MTIPSRIRAAGAHFLFSCLIALLSAMLVFKIWYPGLIATFSGVQDIYLLILAIDVCLGPTITLIIFNPRKKSAPELKRDLAIVGAIQLLALLYGLHTVFIARPAFIVYNAGRFDLAYANDLAPENLAKATLDAYRTVPLLGPVPVVASLPTKVGDRNKLLFDSLSGGADLPLLPQYYRPYAAGKTEIVGRLQALETLKSLNPTKQPVIDALIQRYEKDGTPVGFLPLKGKAEDGCVIIERASGKILEFVQLTPWK